MSQRFGIPFIIKSNGGSGYMEETKKVKKESKNTYNKPMLRRVTTNDRGRTHRYIIQK